jgi:hypothetical protein
VREADAAFLRGADFFTAPECVAAAGRLRVAPGLDFDLAGFGLAMRASPFGLLHLLRSAAGKG